MVDFVGSADGLRATHGARASSTSALVCAGSTGCCARRRRRSSPTASGRSPGSRASTSRATPTTTSSARRSPRRRRRRVPRRRARVDPARYRRYRRPLYVGTIGADGVRLRRRRRRPRLEALDRRRPLPVPAVGVRQAALRARPRRLPRRPRRGGSATLRTVLSARRARRWCRSALVFLQPDFGTALVYGAALAAVLFVAGVRWLHLGAARRARGYSRRLGALVAAGGRRPLLKPYQVTRLTGFPHPIERPERRDLQRRRSRSPRSAPAGSAAAASPAQRQTRLDYLPEHATDFVFASLAEQRGFLGASILLLLYLLVVWRGLRIDHGRATTCSARSSRAGSSSRSSSRSSSTSA